MDSTLVRQIGEVAAQLGVQAKTVLVWWLLLRFGETLVICGMLLTVAIKGLATIRHYGRGNRLQESIIAAVMAMPGERRCRIGQLTENDISRAQAILADHWNQK